MPQLILYWRPLHNSRLILLGILQLVGIQLE